MLWFSVQVDEFEVEAVTLLKLRKIRIGHDGRGVGAGWFLDKVVVGQVDTDKYDTEFVCNRWVYDRCLCGQGGGWTGGQQQI